MTLSVKVISGVKWTSVSQVGRQGIHFVTTAILARLLSPSDFGLMGMAVVITGFVNLFKDLGTSAAIIQRKNLSEELLSSIFWVNVAFGFLAMVILILISPLASIFYHEPRVTPLLMVLSLTFFISGLSILQQAILHRDLAFNKLAKLEIIATFAGSIAGIGSAISGYGVWSLVYQSLAIVTVTTILLWISSAWRPRLIFHWAEIKSVGSYSLNLTGFNIFNYFIRNADNLLIGRFLGAQNLGYYDLAYRIMLYPLASISAVIGRVMFPLYSHMQDDNARFRHAYLKVAGAIALVAFPMMVGLMAVSEQFVLTIFGSQWVPVIVLVMILAPIGMIQSIVTTVGAIYQTKGRTDWMFLWGIASGIIRVISFIIGLRWGIVGVAVAYAISTVLLLYPGFAIPFKLINLPMRDLGNALWRPLFSSSLMLLALLGVKAVLPTNISRGLTLGILVPTGIIAYLLAGWMVNRQQLREVMSIVGVQNTCR